MDIDKLDFIIKKFFVNSQVLNINLIDSGLINKTYLVEHFYNGIKSKFQKSYKDIEDEKFEEVINYIEFLKKNPS